MFQLKRIFITVSIVTCILNQAQSVDKYTDENRPYEFGFTIDGEQHRHEKKDENGIIMGEYGFITADGVYHVTVYATDEFGHFKILSMKNIRVKPYPTAPSRQGHSLSFPPSQQVPASLPQSPSQALSPPHMQSTSSAVAPDQPPPAQETHQFEAAKIEQPSKSCSHCSLPTTSTRAPPPAPVPASLPVTVPEYNKPSAKLGATTAGIPQYSQDVQAIQTSYPNQQSNPQQNSIGGQQSSVSSPQQELSQGAKPPQRLPGQQTNPQDNRVPIQLDYPEHSLPQSSSSSKSNPALENDVQDNNVPIQLNHPQQSLPQSSSSSQSKPAQENDVPVKGIPIQLDHPQHSLPQSSSSSKSNPAQERDVPVNGVPIQLDHPQHGLPQSSSSSKSSPGQETYVQDNKISGQQNNLQQRPSLSLPGKQVNEKPINYINSALNYPQQSNGASQSEPAQQNSVQRGGSLNTPLNQNRPGSVQRISPQGVNEGNNYSPQQGVGSTSSNEGSGATYKQNDRSQPSGNLGGTSRTAKQYDPLEEPFAFNLAGTQIPSEPLSKKPMLIAAQIQIVDKNTDIHYKRPGEQDGLPEGLTKDDMTQLLYTFNYTLGFQGHFEEGYTNGAKQGYYFVTGRNGVRTRVDYVADSKGFRPKITQDVLDLLSDDVPKPETEKDEKYGLKGYEFKWLYYPVETKV